MLRLLKPAAYEWGIEAGYEREPALLTALATRGLPVPRDAQVLRDAAGRVVGTSHRYVGGTPANAVHLRGGANQRFAREVGSFLQVLHSVPLEEARAIGVPEHDLGGELYPRLIETALPLLGPRSRAWLEARFEGFLRAGGSRAAPRVLVHGDISHQHLLTDTSGALLGVIDFADAMIADPALDFAGLLNEGSWAFLHRVLANYEGAAARDPDLERRARFYIEVAALYQVHYGDRIDGGRERKNGLRRLVAQAAAATRAAR